MTSKAITRTAAILAGDKEGGSINTAIALFAGFDDWMEEQQPGHKARCAAANAERERQRAL